MHAALRAEGHRCSRGRVERLMRRHRIRALAGRRFRPCTTDSRHYLPIAPNLLAQNFVATAPNRIWLADITYSAPRPGWSGVHMTGMQRRKEESNECLALCCEGA